MSSILQLQSEDGAVAEVHAQGAHVTSWQPADGTERLFLSSRSVFAPGAAIRGGVPVIFPQFADLGPLPKHGFARTQVWDCVEQAAGEGRWVLQSNAATRAIWPQAFRCELLVRIKGPQLRIELTVVNTGDTTMRFTAALHSYLRVAAIEPVRLAGLQHLRYRDKTRGDAEFVEHATALAIEGEVDRVYLDAPSRLELIEPERRLLIEQAGFSDTVVWNPGPQAGAALRDLEDEGYRRMLCVEAATVGRPVELAPGASWRGSQTLIA